MKTIWRCIVHYFTYLPCTHTPQKIIRTKPRSIKENTLRSDSSREKTNKRRPWPVSYVSSNNEGQQWVTTMSGLAWVCGVVYTYIYMVSSTKRQRCTPHVIARYARSHAKTPAWLVVVRRAAARVPPRPHVPKIAQIGLPVRQNLPLSALPCSYSILFVYMRKGSRSDSLVNRKMYTRKRVK